MLADDDTAWKVTVDAMAKAMATEDFAEGPRAFIEKRAPRVEGPLATASGTVTAGSRSRQELGQAGHERQVAAPSASGTHAASSASSPGTGGAGSRTSTR